MKFTELLRLVWINLVQNKFKVILTSIGIVVGAATIVMVIAIGTGGQMEVAEQFKNINAGAIDISYETAAANSKSSGSQNGGYMQNMRPMGNNSFNNSANSSANSSANNPANSSANNPANSSSGNKGGFDRGNMIIGGSSSADSRVNQEKITLTENDMEDLNVFLPGILESTITYTQKSNVNGGDLEKETSYTIAGVKSNYINISNLSLSVGEFVTDTDAQNAEKICILGASAAKEIFGTIEEAYDSIVYIDSRPYIVNGVVEEVGTVSSGISPDESIFIPYETGIKYLTGTNVNPTITVIAEDVNNIETVVENIQAVLGETYPNAEFTITDAGSKMEAASESNNTLTILLIAMAAIVFIVGGIGIMNVLFVSVKERTQEIGILKALGSSKKDILVEFLLEACFISVIGGFLGVILSFGITPLVQHFNVRVELSFAGDVIAVCFAIITGTVFGFYPALKASKLVPVEALSAE